MGTSLNITSFSGAKGHPFGSQAVTLLVASKPRHCMQGRAFSSAAYMYGLNGKEKEAEGTADNYDFGARIYDGRLGRWLSVDPLFAEMSNVSLYKFGGNSPLIYNDPDEKKEFLRIVFKDADGNVTAVQLTEMSEDYYEYKKESTSAGGHDTEYKYEYYDIYNVVEVKSDANGVLTSSGYTETSAKPIATRYPLTEWIPIVRTDPNIEHSKTGTHESHIEDGIGGQVEVDCKELEK